MKVLILGVTKAFDKYCIAGLTEEGKWVRPISNSSNTRFWEESLLQFPKGYGFLRAGDLIEFQGYEPRNFQHENHTEDIVVRDGRITLLRRYSNYELLSFLEGKDNNETVFLNTVHARKRSLCLVKADKIDFQITQYENEPKKPKIVITKQEYSLKNPQTNYGNYIVKDCKWNNLILNEKVTNNDTFNCIYVALGLATPNGYDGVEYPQIIGIHTDPEVPISSMYPH